MTKKLEKLKPHLLWEIFEEICAIPHPSGREEGVREYLIEKAKTHKLSYQVDEVGNLLIRKEASPGFENRQGVILQGHIDMVPQKNSDKAHDFEKDPIDAYIDGEWVTANGTTLGADNGIGVAAAMTVLLSDNLVHGPLEAIFTIDEETGMTGAFGLKPGFMKGDIMLNLDSEDEGELYIGCAGGINGNFNFNYKEEAVPAGHVAYDIKITGLKGGHSGLDINLGRGNANKILFRYLSHASSKHGVRLASVNGGSLRNAIPREAFASIILPAANEDAFHKCLKDYIATISAELSRTEPELKMEAVKGILPNSIIDKETEGKIIRAVYACPNGVIRMSDSMPGLVETSTNLAIVKSEKGKVNVMCLLRSSVDSAKDDLQHMMASVFELAGATIEFSGAYPGWKPNPDSAILTTMKGVYNMHYGKVPDIKAIHAGLECGLIGGVYPKLDMISFGPTIRFPHSPDEKVHIESVDKFWTFLVETLKNIPVRK